ncbi:glycosyltransferase family 2 protein [candidate division TA06 bacterium]|uniref:Glycosyltransferase family 2 protein n=1 Tax=candidate division TA06 bacterium TaxID=2250710 RepID=A0A660SMY0_UNCT6|nr:MAG: glycosyltransferase family 2 protein [candidate division TA06 bacterium]
MDKDKLLILIPAYNESKFIGNVITRVKASGYKNILVIDDGSNDDTYNIALSNKINVIRHNKNRGKGESQKTGFNYAYENNYDYIAMIDADNQHNPEEIEYLLRKANRYNYDIVIGKRIDYSRMPYIREIVNKITSLIISIMSKNRIYDSQSGFRIMRTRLIPYIRLKTKRFETESEILIQTGRSGYKIGEHKIKTFYGSEKSSVNPVIDTLRFISLISMYTWV